ncbi:MAG: hypothetical protein R3F43_14885 [bacterium]
MRRHLSFVARIQGIARHRRRAAVDEVLERCALGPVADRLVEQLSKGYRQRVGVAQAIDAPATRPHPRRADVRPRSQPARRDPALIQSLRADRTIIFSSHVLAEVEAVASRVIILHRGRVVADQAADRLLAGRGLRVRVLPAQLAAARDRLVAVPGVAEVAPGRGTPSSLAADPATAPAVARALEAWTCWSWRPSAGIWRRSSASSQGRHEALALARRELSSTFDQPIATLVLAAFLALSGSYVFVLRNHFSSLDGRRCGRCSSSRRSSSRSSRRP